MLWKRQDEILSVASQIIDQVENIFIRLSKNIPRTNISKRIFFFYFSCCGVWFPKPICSRILLLCLNSQ